MSHSHTWRASEDDAHTTVISRTENRTTYINLLRMHCMSWDEEEAACLPLGSAPRSRYSVNGPCRFTPPLLYYTSHFLYTNPTSSSILASFVNFRSLEVDVLAGD